MPSVAGVRGQEGCDVSQVALARHERIKMHVSILGCKYVIVTAMLHSMSVIRNARLVSITPIKIDSRFARVVRGREDVVPGPLCQLGSPSCPVGVCSRQWRATLKRQRLTRLLTYYER